MRKKQSSKMTAKVSKKGSKSLAEKTERILLTMPKIIAAQINKDLVLLKKQLSKLKEDLRKAESTKQQLSQQQMTLQMRKTPAAKKKMSTNQKGLQKASLLIHTLKRGVELVNKQAADLSQKKEKYSALQIQLSRFQKDWSKKPSSLKKSKIKTKSAMKGKKLADLRSGLMERQFNAPQVEMMEVIELPLQSEVEFEQE